MPRRLPRFYLEVPLAPGETVALAPEQARQVGSVLRLRAGDSIVLFNGDGTDYVAVISAKPSRQGVSVTVEGAHPAPAYPPPQLSLALALIKAERFDWAIQKATELGIATILPMETEHGVVSLPTGRAQHRSERWRRIAAEAAEQCGRATVPRIEDVLPFAAVVQRATSGPAVLLWEDERQTQLSSIGLAGLTHLTLLVGPEGGFSAAEVTLAREAGLPFASLGPLVLRAETAAIAGIAAVRALAAAQSSTDDGPDSGTDTESSCAS